MTAPRKGSVRFAAGIGVLAAGAMVASLALGQPAPERSGKEIVNSLCISCHGSGAQGAPKIGDNKAWAARASKGLSGLTKNALAGIRQMPAHGGNPNLTDTEIERAITYMVNQSGGHWAEPISRTRPPVERSGEQVVQAQCAKCHATGIGGAPVIGDRAAWIPRAKQGLDTLVRSAINGHGGMPPRGGQANLTDPEIRSAVVYMLNPTTNVVAVRPADVSAPVTSGQNFRIVGDTTVYLGIVSADVMRSHAKEYPSSTYGSAPMGPDQFYLTVTLLDADSGRRISDASVSARISAAAASGREKTLKAITVSGTPSFGDYFAMAGPGPFQITLHIKQPDKPDRVEARFDYAP